MPKTCGFERIGRDPRRIAHDLTRITVSKYGTPSETLARWPHLYRRWGVSPSLAEY